MTNRSQALLTLMAQIFEHEQSGRQVPCVNPALGHWWLSDDADEQEAAALACASCPALRQCRTYVAENPENGGVWAARIPATNGRRARDLIR